MIETEEPEAAIVFCNTRNDTSLVTAVLNRNGYDAELLNGDLPQKERERVMAKVKRGEVRFMVATDIAARGIDISDLTHVINYSLPEDPAVYLHRVGRTGRIGKKGTALSLVSGAEIMTLSALQKRFGIQFETRTLPTPEEARRRWTDRHVAELKESMSASVFEGFIPLAQELKARPDGEYLTAFALKYFFTHHRMERMHDVQKAEHKREEHERKEYRVEKRERREGRREREPRRGERTEAPRSEVPVEVRVESPAAPRSEERPERSKVYLTLGEQDGADEARVRQVVKELAPDLELLEVEVRRSHSYLHVRPESLEAAVAALDGKEAGGKKLAAEKARRRRR
jgi:ATP-dependent RNA helicase DeaD